MDDFLLENKSQLSIAVALGSSTTLLWNIKYAGVFDASCEVKIPERQKNILKQELRDAVILY